MQITPKTATGISGTVVELTLSEMIVLRSLAWHKQTLPTKKAGTNFVKELPKGRNLLPLLQKSQKASQAYRKLKQNCSKHHLPMTKRNTLLATKVALQDIKADCKKNRTPVYVKYEGIITNILKTNVGKAILCG